MKASLRPAVLATLFGAAALAWLAPADARPAKPAAPAPAVAPRAPASPASRARVPGHEALEQDALALGLAAMDQAMDGPQRVIADLEAVRWTPEPTTAEADRAAFLLAQAYLRVGALERFRDLAAEVSQWQRTSAYTRWLAAEARLLALGGDGALGLDALAGMAAGDTLTRLGRDIAGATALAAADSALAHGEDPRPALVRVPAGSRYSLRALHLYGLAALEHGDTAAGDSMLAVVFAADSISREHREAGLALAGQALDRGDWLAAHERYRAIDGDWQAQHATLEQLLASGQFDTLWAAWRSDPGNSDALVLDSAPLLASGQGEATRAADLTSHAAGEPPAAAAPARTARAYASVDAPPAAEWARLTAAGQRVAVADAARAEARQQADRERAALAERQRFLEFGRTLAGAQASLLTSRGALLDSLRAQLAAEDARLRGVRDEERAHVQARTQALLERALANQRWLHAMRWLYRDAADRARAPQPPEGYPSVDSLVAAEDSLVLALTNIASRVQVETPAMLAQSYERAWRPRLIDRVTREAGDAASALAWARRLQGSLDSSFAAAAGSARLDQLLAADAPLARRADSLRLAEHQLGDSLARAAIRRTLAALVDEREGIDYGLAASAYALSVQLSAADSGSARVAVSTGAAHDTSAAGDQPESPEATRWRAEAIPALEHFLTAHPASAARGEMRFRLADLELVAARETFRAQMAAFMHGAGGPNGAHAVPLLDPSRALALYRSILAEDATFAHRDAVLFNAGMILADQGEPEADRYFHDLVTTHPQSVYCQEAYLRMGDARFNDKRFPESVELYAHAAAGGDPTLRVIANYKLGWAHFNEDHFPAAADAFRAVLDLYGSPDRERIQVDIAGEAESYLVYSLAGAGGAEAFAHYFDPLGPRPYEKRVLLALGTHFRHYGEYPAAAAADTLFLQRYPDQPEALIAAQRLIETYHRSDRPALEEQARLSYAARFGPDGAWARAQASDSLRAAGDAFAREALKTVAFAHHRLARTNGAAADWRQALTLYDRVLATWPKDADAPQLQFAAGEASAELGDPQGALARYSAAAKSGPDSLAQKAMWQRVAVTDAWYERSRPHAAPGAVAIGSDSLARAVLMTGDELLARFPAHPRAADIVWRQGQLAFAHGWLDTAATTLGRMAEHFVTDPRTPLAANQRGDALFRLGRFDEAGKAFADAATIAHAAGRDTLERRALAAEPVCAYRFAEAAVARDSSKYARHAELFEQVATRWPDDALAPKAEYRAGLAYAHAEQPREAVRVMQALVQRYPRCEYVRDARLEIAHAWEAANQPASAALAYQEFAEKHPDDASAAAATLKAADLFVAANDQPHADALRLAYIRQHPNDTEAVMEILEGFARRELDAVTAEHPISTLLPVPLPKGRRHAVAPPASHLAEYLRHAAAAPRLASRPLIAQVRFLQGEEAYTPYAALRLTQPLPKSIPVKQHMLDSVLVRYRRTIDLGVAEWAHAAAFRMGQALVGFGDALDHAERPADLHGADLKAYDDVLAEQSRTFAERGENLWTDLLRQKPQGTPADRWTTQAQTLLWQRLANRFLYKPELEYPLVEAVPPPRTYHDGAVPETSDAPARHDKRASGKHRPQSGTN